MTHSDGLIRPGSPAPDFALPATPDGRRTGPGQFRGRPVVLAFHPADRTPVCGRQVNPGADGILDALEQLGTERRVVAG